MLFTKFFEQIKHLNSTCQKPNYRKVGNLMVRYFERDAAIYITYFLVKTLVSANHVTLMAMFTALVSAYYFWVGSPEALLIGALLYQFWYLLDHVDGQVARYQKKSSPEGVFLDYLMHHLVDMMPFTALAWPMYIALGDSTSLVYGFSASISLAMVGFVSDIELKTAHHTRAWVVRKEGAAPTLAPSKQKRISLPRVFFAFLHKTCEGHIVMNVITVFSIGYYFTKGSSWFWSYQSLQMIAIYYSVVATLVWVFRSTNTVLSQKISRGLL